MATRLRDYFPMLRTRQEIIEIINDSPVLASRFAQWEEERQQEFLDFCSGAAMCLLFS